MCDFRNFTQGLGFFRTRDDGKEVVPATTHTAGVALDELTQGDAHLLLYCAWAVHVPADVEELCAVVVLQIAPLKMSEAQH